ncbi:MAG: DUF4159 domain-containing protein [Verrucomicrobiota bacterium]|nr:DUF4159 domain-containing protein [Verrucomicrobiota bacterium]
MKNINLYTIYIFSIFCFCDIFCETLEKETKKIIGPEVHIAQLIQGRAISRHYPYALPTLLKYIKKETTLNVNQEVKLLTSFEDRRMFQFPFIYVNYADRKDWHFTEKEKTNLRSYLERGGFIYIDAGINADFLSEKGAGQHHSYAEWRAAPDLAEAFKELFPEKDFVSLPRSHPLFSVFYSGLPDTEILPDTVREFVKKEKWPGGTYSAVSLKFDGRIGVLATPIIAMGWGKNNLGQWQTTIRFRIRENTDGLSEYLKTAAYSGARFEVMREEGTKDIVFCQKRALPAWVNEPDGEWRVFRYYQSTEISDYAHVFYTRLGANILIYAMTH